MKLIMTVAILFMSMAAQAEPLKTGACQDLALKAVLDLASSNKELKAKVPAKENREMKAEVVSQKTLDAGDTFFDKYLIQVYYFSKETNSWQVFTGNPSQIVYSYDWSKNSGKDSGCALNFFSLAGYAFDDYENIGGKK